MYRWFPSILTVVTIVQPETPARWHRAGFRRYWRWKSNPRGRAPAKRDGIARARSGSGARRTSLGARRASTVPVVNQIRTYCWCSPLRIWRQQMCPASSTARETGASFPKDMNASLSRCDMSCTTAVHDRGVPLRFCCSVASKRFRQATAGISLPDSLFGHGEHGAIGNNDTASVKA
jgi:hypothetical protein